MTLFCSYNNYFYLDKVDIPDSSQYYECVKFKYEYQPNTAKYAIFGPYGSYANYIGWLVFLDSKFSLVNRIDENYYTVSKGIDWPLYNNYVIGNFSNIKDEIVDEIKIKFVDDFSLISIADKLNFFKNIIFSKTRSWNNWIITEWKYNNAIKPIIIIDHKTDEYRLENKKNLLLTIDPISAYKSYLKFNSSLGYLTKDQFIDRIDKSNTFSNTIKNSNVLTVDTTILFNPTLDRGWYSTLINWFELEDHYDIANQVHNLWYSAHERAEQDFVADIIKLYKN